MFGNWDLYLKYGFTFTRPVHHIKTSLSKEICIFVAPTNNDRINFDSVQALEAINFVVKRRVLSNKVNFDNIIDRDFVNEAQFRMSKMNISKIKKKNLSVCWIPKLLKNENYYVKFFHHQK